jgi:hypothetical protein
MSRREAVGLVELALRLPGFRFGACFLAALRFALFFFARLRVFFLAAIGGFSFSSGTVWWRTWIGLALR